MGAATELLHMDTWILAVQAAPTARRGTQAFSPGNESLGHVRRAAPTETLKSTSTSSLTPVLGPLQAPWLAPVNCTCNRLHAMMNG
jgi:hypothetical protein